MTIEINTPSSTATLKNPKAHLTGAEVRKLARANLIGDTGGLGHGYVQCNLLIVPARYADDFRRFCQRNPVSCPLVAETAPGDPTVPSHIAADCDIRTDLSGYCVYKDGELVATKTDVLEEWEKDTYVAFLIGCSYSFEHALLDAGITMRHREQGTVVSVYKSKIPLNAAGPFSGAMVVSMRPFKADKVKQVQEITKKYMLAHGEPMLWGDEGTQALGIDINKTDWGQPTNMEDDDIPAYWGCGISPQTAVMDSKVEGTFMAHRGGYMLVTDLRVEDVCA
ncbi:hypothetical protein M231_00695 [Tremella mesenterica]|uniref:DUF1445 domain-containing protein n=1 Tax=Tremella mesenterica TaxID=5217 RepID=A0A4Q1BV03_TREME|nr:hypothetical protein M231_00695 [Tremella mesenterica]